MEIKISKKNKIIIKDNDDKFYELVRDPDKFKELILHRLTDKYKKYSQNAVNSHIKRIKTIYKLYGINQSLLDEVNKLKEVIENYLLITDTKLADKPIDEIKMILDKIFGKGESLNDTTGEQL